MTARYQTDSQTIKCIQHPFLNFLKMFLNFLQRALTVMVTYILSITLTAVEIPGVASRTEVPQVGQRQQQNSMLRKDS